MNNTKFIAFDTGRARLRVERIHERGVVRCRIPCLPLVRGRYKLTIFAEINGACADRLTDALDFEVMGGQHPTVGWVTVDHEWDCASN
jgi:hypothetical protein